METGYSADAVASAKSLQTYTYICTSMVTLWTYDYACSIDKEWTFLLQSRWAKIKVLYIVTRYTPFLLFAGRIFQNFSPNENFDKCQMINNICAAFSIISVLCSECFFILRTYALWNRSKIVLAVILTAFSAVLVTSLIVTFSASATTTFNTSVNPAITGCYQYSGSIDPSIPFLLLCMLELGLVILTLIRAILHWRMTRNPLYAVLLKHNFFYYACSLFFSVVNALASLFLHYAYQGMFQDFQIVILAILATHMHLHLWYSDQQLHGSDGLRPIPLSDISSGGLIA
ncbi:hypothetical protein M405DRAFT_937563 [Rhizopogon salebrosus TDB-379]|nr:hypothetical protein M405DRAFT_937563 [Rhizopogon salebrosus TDB-379]